MSATLRRQTVIVPYIGKTHHIRRGKGVGWESLTRLPRSPHEGNSLSSARPINWWRGALQVFEVGTVVSPIQIYRMKEDSTPSLLVK